MTIDNAAKLSAILAIQQEIAEAPLDPEMLMSLIVERTRALTGAESAVIEVVEGDNLRYHCVSGILTPFRDLRLAIGNSLSGLALRGKGLLRCDDAETDPRVDQETRRKTGVRSMLVMPLCHGDNCHSVLKVLSTRTHAFTTEDELALQMLAGLLGAALQHARDFQALEKITVEHERARRFLEAFMEQAAEGIVACDAEGQLILFSEGIRQSHGRDIAPILPDGWASYYGLYQPDGLTPMRKEEVPLYRAFCGESFRGVEMMIYTPEGQQRTVVTQGQPIHGPEGERLGALVLMHDITEIRQAEQDLRQANAALRQRKAELTALNQSLESFSYSVSHDLRAPLRALDGFARILEEDYGDRLDAEGQKHLERIRGASQHMAALIDALLELSRLDRQQLRIQKIDLGQISRTISMRLRQSDPAREVVFDIPEKLPAEADPGLLERVLENLIGNAWKFSAGKCPARISIGSESQGEEIVYFVRDNGAGFDMNYAHKLFQVFQRLHSSREFEGIGIGLNIVKRSIERHGGRIWAEGKPSEGATFRFTLQRSMV